MKRLLSGNEAFAWGAYHAGVKVATAYPGTPSTEILENFARFDGVYAEWSTNEKVAMEVGMGASYAGVRVLVSMKQVGLNVAMDPFMAVSTTGINGGMVVISADDPGTHSSQNEQDNRHYARLAKVPVLEPSDSQEAYDIMRYTFEISERFDTPVIVRTTTRISHSKSVVQLGEKLPDSDRVIAFKYDITKQVMLPAHARIRHSIVEDRLLRLAEFGETSPANRVEMGDASLGVVTSGIAYQYAREVFPDASFLKLGITFPLPEKMVRNFAHGVKKLIVVEELDPVIQLEIQAMGLQVSGKEFIPRLGELDPDTVAFSARGFGLLPQAKPVSRIDISGLSKRPPLLCPGCPHTAMFHVLGTIGRRIKLPGAKGKTSTPGLVIAGDIGCYSLGAYPPLNAMDTTACMGASIGQALGMAKAGIARDQVVAVIGDSTFLHSGVTSLIDAVYNGGQITVIILDNGTTAMTGHQDHPGTGVSAQGQPAGSVRIEDIVRGIGVKNVHVLNAFDVKELRSALRKSLDTPELSVLIVRGDCITRVRKRAAPNSVDEARCSQCGTCLVLGCPAIQSEGGKVSIDASLCVGNVCGVCQQVCPKKAIGDLEHMVLS